MTFDETRHKAIQIAAKTVIGHVLGLKCGPISLQPTHSRGSEDGMLYTLPHETIARWQQASARASDRDKNPRVRCPTPVRACRATVLQHMAGQAGVVEIFGAEQALGAGCPEGSASAFAGSKGDIVICSICTRQKRMRRQVERLVRRHRVKIDRLSQVLLERKTLRPEEIETIIATNKPSRISPSSPDGVSSVQPARAARRQNI